MYANFCGTIQFRCINGAHNHLLFLFGEKKEWFIAPHDFHQFTSLPAPGCATTTESPSPAAKSAKPATASVHPSTREKHGIKYHSKNNVKDKEKNREPEPPLPKS